LAGEEKTMDETQRKEKCDFENLVLLMGTNPLPNLVVAEYFIKNNKNLKNIFLIHSIERKFQEPTETQAKNLGEVLRKRYGKDGKLEFSLTFVELTNVSDAIQICRELQEQSVPELKGTYSVHLNYTGGTKVMGVHVYRFIEKEIKGIKKSFSYFDGRTFKIVDDDDGKFTSDDLREESKITFAEIINLHGFIPPKKKDTEWFSASLEQIEKLFSEGKLDEFKDSIADFYDDYLLLRKARKKSPELTEITGEKLKLNKYGEGPLFPVIRAMPEKYKFFDENRCFDYSKLRKKDGEFVNFLNRIWLEHYVYHLLKSDLNESNTSVDWDWKIKKDGWDYDFQIDVILKKGFQLVGISCTASLDKDICKQKGFEAIHRTRQIGGDESKAVLVTLLVEDIVKDLEKQLKKDSGCPEGFFKVIGKDQLEKNEFLEEFKKFLQYK
jgi:hypothetical protein